MSDTLTAPPAAPPEDPGFHDEDLWEGDYVDEDGILHISTPWMADVEPVSVNEEPVNAPGWVSASPYETAYGKDFVQHHRALEGYEDNPDQVLYNERARALGDVAATFLQARERVESYPGAAWAQQHLDNAARDARTQVARIRSQVKEQMPTDYEEFLNGVGIGTSGRLSDEALEKFYRSRLDKLDREGQERQEALENHRQEFMAALTWAAEHGLPIDLDRAKERVEALEIKLFDALTSKVPEEGFVVGFYDGQTDALHIAHDGIDYSDTDSGKRIMFHELMHAVAGMRMVRHGNGNLERQWQGLKNRKADFIWLDESITERLSQILLASASMTEDQRQKINFATMTMEDFFYTEGVPPIGETAYANEQLGTSEILAAIPPEEKPMQAVLGAYFEDYEPAGYGDGGERQPMRKRLFGLLHSVIDLRRMEQVYTDYGDRPFKDIAEDRTLLEMTLQEENNPDSRVVQMKEHRRRRQADRERTEHNIAKWYGKRAA